jgi:3-oxoadipate enol-lactonase
MAAVAFQTESVTLPPGRQLELPGRGTTFVRELPGPRGAPVLLLLHGWTVTSDLNWFTSFEELGQRYRVVAMDHRGHGRGIRTNAPFRLVDCADDAAALCDVLGIDRVVPVGYSMGGMVAQLLWRRYPDLVSGMVLSCTAANFNSTTRERAMFSAVRGLATLSRLAPPPLRAMTALRIVTGRSDRDLRQWAYGEVARHDWLAIVQAGREIGRFDSRRWIRNLDVPAAVVVTLDDEVVPPSRQLALVGSLPDATLHEGQGGHATCINEPETFVPALLTACESVTARLRPR